MPKSEMIRTRQVAYVPNLHACNDIKLIFDHNTDDRNIPLFAKFEAVMLYDFGDRQYHFPQKKENEQKKEKATL